MPRDDFSIPGYDAWKTRAPEDERSYWDDKEPPEPEPEVIHQCHYCGKDYECPDPDPEKCSHDLICEPCATNREQRYDNSPD